MKKSLESLLDEDRLALEVDLARSDNTRKAVAEINLHIDQMQADYLDELTVHQVPVAASMLQVARSILSSLEATRAEVWEKPANQSSSPLTTAGIGDGLLAAKTVQLLSAVALIMTLFSSQSWTALVLASVLVGAGAFVRIQGVQPGASFPRLLLGRRAKYFGAGEETVDRLGVVRVVPQGITDCLRETFAAIDAVVDHTLPPAISTPKALTIEKEFPDVIDLFYELLSAKCLNDDAGLRKLVEGRLTQVLRQVGIDVLCYPPPVGRSAERLFELQSSNDPEVSPHLLMYPALAREDRVVAQGSRIGPVVRCWSVPRCSGAVNSLDKVRKSNGRKQDSRGCGVRPGTRRDFRRMRRDGGQRRAGEFGHSWQEEPGYGSGS